MEKTLGASSGVHCLSGNWTLRRKGSDYLAEIEGIPGLPPIAELLSSTPIINIAQVSEGACDEVHISMSSAGASFKHIYHLGMFNVESEVGKAVVLSTAVHFDRDFKEFSALRLGPAKGQRSLEQFKLEPGGDAIRVEIDLVLPSLGKKKLVKYLTRVPESQIPDPEFFRGINATTNWAHLATHTPRVFKTVSISIPVCVTIPAQTAPARPASAPPATSADDLPRVARHFAGQLNEGQEITVFKIEVNNGTDSSWKVWRRYREFDALRLFVETELEGNEEALALLPPFPRKTVIKVRGKGLDQRREALQLYLQSVIEQACFQNINIVDAFCAFLEIPEHSVVANEVVSVQNLLRSQVIDPHAASGKVLMAAVQKAEDAYPKHILLSKLLSGMRFIKHGRSGAPRVRLLRCNPTLTRLYWSDEDAVALPPDYKSIVLSDITEIRKATALDPTKPGYCGTASLRRNLKPAEYSVSFTIITPARNLEIQCMNYEDFLLLYTNLTKYTSKSS